MQPHRAQPSAHPPGRPPHAGPPPQWRNLPPYPPAPWPPPRPSPPGAAPGGNGAAAIIGALVAALSGIVTIVVTVASCLPKDTTVAVYRDDTISMCRRVLAIRETPGTANVAIDPRTGTVDVRKFVAGGRQQLDREKAVLDEFFARPAPEKLSAQHGRARTAADRWYRYATGTVLNGLQRSLPRKASLDQVNAVAAELSGGYAPVVASLNNALGELAGRTCTAMKP